MSALCATIPTITTNERIENKMKISYSIWQGANLLSVDNTANNADELLDVMKDLNKLGKGFTYNVRKVEVNN
jgi:hypothetical protein